MAWSTPTSRVPGDLITATFWNELVGDLVYLKGKTDSLFAVSGQTNQSVTILSTGANTVYCYITGAVYNETTGATGTLASIRAPGGASIANSPGGGATTITVVFNANGSITASRTAGSDTWGLRLSIVYN